MQRRPLGLAAVGMFSLIAVMVIAQYYDAQTPTGIFRQGRIGGGSVQQVPFQPL